MTVIDPFGEPGSWVVRTASGACHLLDSRDPDAPVTVTRLTADAPPSDEFRCTTLRRDGAPLKVAGVHHLDPVDGLTSGVVVGLDMWLVLEPLSPDASATVRRTTPVVRIVAASSQPGLVEVEERSSDG